MISANGQCICDDKSINQSGNCILCTGGFYKQDNECLECPELCASCESSTVCTSCKLGYSLNPLLKICCGAGELFNATAGQCNCIPNMFNVSGKCSVCRTGTKYNPVTQLCEDLFSPSQQQTPASPINSMDEGIVCGLNQ